MLGPGEPTAPLSPTLPAWDERLPTLLGSRLLPHNKITQTSALVIMSPLSNSLLPSPAYKDIVMTLPSPAHNISGYLPISRPLTVTSAKPLWPCQVTYSQVLRIRAWTALGGIILPHAWS